jgi:hypothetical protein
MKGDFSNWRDERRQNFTGVLHQQGRVLLDADWNAQTAITIDWQDTAARDIIGADVAAVPADQAGGFKITAAERGIGADADKVKLTVALGSVWVDGLFAEIYKEPDPAATADVKRWATYLKPPLQSLATVPALLALGNSIRDAVVLEVWREELNAYQRPELLFEAALGGPDTTQRVQTSMAFRLMRLAAGQTCESIRDSLKDKFDQKGKLIATLQAPTTSTGHCPTVTGGGYTGFEHNLYRIEIADVTSLPAQFKWSEYGGGLVGRGIFVTGPPNKINITTNLQAIASSGLSQVYLEALRYDELHGRWIVTYGARANLSNGVLTPDAPLFGSQPATGTNIFFRLWNGIAPVQNGEHELPNNVGILLNFDAPDTGKYVAGDYWTFPVRAGEIENANPLVGKRVGAVIQGVPPKGIHYHRVPLAVLEWTGNAVTPIDDCRHIFQPLTRHASCCSYRVGDGVHTWGDFQTISDALAALPAAGGEICVLPGEYKENLLIENKRDITIKGCGARSRIIADTTKTTAPIIRIRASQNIRIESLSITAYQDGVGLLLEGPDMFGATGGTLRGITLANLSVKAAERCAIEAHVGFDVTIRDCDIEMSDVASDAPGIFFAGDDSLIAHNSIRVISEAGRSKLGPIAGGRTLDTDLFQPAIRGRGGLNIGGTSERVRVVNNLIQGGTGNGITLGTLVQQLPGAIPAVIYPGSRGVIDQAGRSVDSSQLPTPPAGGAIVADGALHEIHIERNCIYNMGANGIGVAAFFDLGKQDEFISVDRLTIVGNEIRRCLGRPIEQIPATMQDGMGYGGIALADVEYLVIRDNVIENNGPSHLMPICGVYVLHGEGIEISRNRILNNGANDGVPPQKGARPGPRGGIFIAFGIAPRVPFIPNQVLSIPAQNGVPAIKIHDNSVSAPLGQALALVALGPVSVIGNQFTSLGLVGTVSSSTTWAATVLIFNLGLSNELYLQLIAFSAVALGSLRTQEAIKTHPEDNIVSMGKPGLDDAVPGGYLANGNVLFSNNQCTLNLMDQIQEFALSSVLIASLDDVSFHDNQCDCDLLLGDLVFTQAILFGISLRATDNRFKEGLWGAWLSAVTLGVLNMTTDNQSTHCLLVLGAIVEDQPNHSLLDAFSPRLCGLFRRIGRNFGKPNDPPPTTSTTSATKPDMAQSTGRIRVEQAPARIAK